jgi:hypothetical protein
MIEIARLSDVTIDVTLVGIPGGVTVTKCYLAIKTTDAVTDAAGLVVSTIPVGGVATFSLTDAQTATLESTRHAMSVKAILSDGRAVRLVLDERFAEILDPGVEAIA